MQYANNVYTYKRNTIEKYLFELQTLAGIGIRIRRLLMARLVGRPVMTVCLQRWRGGGGVSTARAFCRHVVIRDSLPARPAVE